MVVFDLQKSCYLGWEGTYRIWINREIDVVVTVLTFTKRIPFYEGSVRARQKKITTNENLPKEEKY